MNLPYNKGHDVC